MNDSDHSLAEADASSNLPQEYAPDAQEGMDQNEMESNTKCISLAPSVVKSLDLIDGKGCLFQLLQKCSTPQGSRLLQHRIVHPLADVREIEKRLDLMELFVQKPSFRTIIAETHLRKFPDFAPLVKRLEKKRVTIQDLYKIYAAVMKIPSLISAMKEGLEDVEAEIVQLFADRFLSKLNTFYEQLTNFRELVKQTVDVHHILQTGEYRIKPDVTPQLQEMSNKMDSIECKMRADWSHLADEVGVEKEKVLKLERDGRLGYLYRVTRKEEKQLRAHNNRLRIKTIDTKLGGFRFRTPLLEDLNEKHRTLSREYQQAQQEVVAEIVETAATFHEPCRTFNEILAPLDVACATARVAFEASIPFVRPQILPKEAGLIELMDSRHPCMENFQFRGFIANSVRFKHDEETFHIVTGPNMGGKSTFIRQVALNIILAQMGCFVPCRSATISLVDGIFTRVGAGDSVTTGVSTFMMEMLEAQDILKLATKYSLIIIDELGRGTSTYDGYGLAYAIAEHIATELGSYCLFTTHFNELASLQKHASTVTLKHVAALVSEDGITFQYNVEPGVSSQSFGINVAQMAGLPENVIKDSRSILEELEKAHRLGLEASSS